MTLLGALAGGRWSSPAELLDGVEQLGVEALLASADRAGDLGEVEDELFRFGQVVDGSPRAGRGARRPDRVRSGRARDAGRRRCSTARRKPATVRLATLALRGFGGRTFAGALTRLVELAAERRDQQVAYVTVATPLPDAEEERLGARARRDVRSGHHR